jgi:hypothetical protein
MKKTYVGFDKLVDKLKGEKNPPNNPEAVAAAIGRKKYGAKAMENAAKKGKSLKGK